MRKLLVIGAGGHGKVVADIARKNNYRDIAFLDDDRQLESCGDCPVLGGCGIAARYPEADFIIAVGNAKMREEIQRYICSLGLHVITLVHPDAVVGGGVVIGLGSVVMAGAVVNPGAELGEGCIVNTCASVDHDCKISGFVHVAVGSHVAGGCTVGSRTWIGIGAVISNNLNICSGCMIGAGAVVIKDIREPGIYVGVPAERKIGMERISGAWEMC